MINKQRIYFLLFLVLIVVAGYFFFNDEGTTLKSEFSNFAIEDTNSISRIFIADYEGNNADLKRVNDTAWMINDKHLVRPDAISLLMNTFHDIEVREPVAKSAFETAVKELAVRSTKVEIYTGGRKPEKVYYIGHATKTHYGTNMLLEIDGKKSSVPYIMHIPGFFGYLSTRFFTDEDLWRDRSIFPFNAHEIQHISIAYLEKPGQSFELLRDQEAGVKVIDLQERKPMDRLNLEAINEYVSRYPKIHYEMIDKESSEAVIDSVINTPPLHVIEVSDFSGKKVVLKTYYKPVTDGTINPSTGEAYTYNLDRLFGYVNNEDFVLIQWPTLDKILAYYSDFRKPENVNN